MESPIKITGKLNIVVTDQAGSVTTDKTVDNLVVDTGKTFIAASFLKTTTNNPVAMTHMAVGQGTAAAAVGDTVMGNELTRVTLASATSTGAGVTYTASFPAGVGTGPITEAGILNAASAGTMLCRTVFSVVNKGASDVMSITWTITVL